MVQTRTCRHGHQWEGSPDRPDNCPRCGAPAETIRATADDPTGADLKAPGDLPATLAAGRAATMKGPGGKDLPAIEGYAIECELGRGGMGVVYKARHLKLNRPVALKMVLGGPAADPQYCQRFHIEVQAVAQLQHPNIVQIFEVGEHNGQPYCSFEFLEGGDLDDKFQGKPQPADEAARLIETLARGIHAAHERGIVHRDLKPANVLLTRDGTPKISDFGLAKRLDADISQTQTGMIMGTPGYMAPEQATGRIRDIGPGTDIYALGAILYEVLTGRPPFVADTAWNVIQLVVTAEPCPPSRIHGKVPPDIEVICLKCLEKEPAQRYASAKDLAEDLRRFLDGGTIVARPVSRVTRSLRWSKRHPAMAGAVAVLVVALGILGLAAKYVWRGGNHVGNHVQEGTPLAVAAPLGLGPVDVPDDNHLTVEKVELGKQLFFDKRLSADNTVACASCHEANNGWTDRRGQSIGIHGQKTSRNSPTVVNSGYLKKLFWDGRAQSLEHQALGPLFNPGELGVATEAALQQKLNAIPGYREQFRKIFGTEATPLNVAKALAAFERTLVAGNAPYDRFEAGAADALSGAARRGKELFFNKAHCSACHSGPLFTDFAFHNLGVSIGAADPDLGRRNVHNLLGNRGAFRTPSLRDVARTAPYMHDGSLRTLEDVVDFYNQGGVRNPQLDEEIFALKLTDPEKQDLVIFLKEGLTSGDYPRIEPPQLPR
jgi:cytochrome c peroxidase/tRNA A-37 threonylcarbamoyl transferase component Bud32